MIPSALDPTHDDDLRVLADAVDAFCFHAHHAAIEWWLDLEDGQPINRPIPDLLMLVTTEIAEAFEAYRTNSMSPHIPDCSGFEEELADATLRIFDMCGHLGIDLGTVMLSKMTHNRTREDHSREARKAPGGKRI